MSQPVHGGWPGSCPWKPPGSQPGSTALGILQNQFPDLAACDSHALPSGGRMPAPGVSTGAWGGTAEVCGAGLGAGGQPVGAGPELGTEGPLLLGPARLGPEFREVSRQGSPRPWPGLALGGAVPQGTGREAGVLSSETDGGGSGGGRAAKREEQTGTVHSCWQGGRRQLWWPAWDLERDLDLGGRKPRAPILALWPCDLGQVIAPL